MLAVLTDCNIHEFQGDEIAVECTYNTTDRSRVTQVPQESRRTVFMMRMMRARMIIWSGLIPLDGHGDH